MRPYLLWTGLGALLGLCLSARPAQPASVAHAPTPSAAPLAGQGQIRWDERWPRTGFNIDFGEAALAPPELGAEGHQPGYWNGIGYTKSARWELRNSRGVRTDTSLELRGASSWIQCLGASQLDPLLRDGVHAAGEDLVLRVLALPPGQYGLWVYAKPHCQAQDTQVLVRGALPEQRCQTLDASGLEPDAAVFAIRVDSDPVEIVLRPAGAQAEVRLSGLQIVPLGRSRGGPQAAQADPAADGQADAENESTLLMEAGVRVALEPRPGSLRVRAFGAAGQPPAILRMGTHKARSPVWEVGSVWRPALWIGPGSQTVWEFPSGAESLQWAGLTIWCQLHTRTPLSNWAAGRVVRRGFW